MGGAAGRSGHETGSAELDRRLSALLARPVSVSGSPPEHGVLERAVPEYQGGLPEAMASRAVVDGTGASITTGQVAAGTFFDFAPVHLVTTGSLASLREHHPALDFDARRFRPNLVIDAPAEASGFPEDAWAGSSLRIGGALFEVMVPTPRCVVPTLRHDELPAAPGIMRTVAREHRVPVLTLGPLACVGVYLRVIEPGPVRVGDQVAVTRTPPVRT